MPSSRRTIPLVPLLAPLGLVALGLACSPDTDGLVPAGSLKCAPPPELGPVAVGDSVTVEVACTVGARIGLELLGGQAPAPFRVTTPEGIWRPGTVPIAVTFAPTAPGRHEGEVAVAYRVDGADEVETFPVTGLAEGDVPWPEDPPPPACRADGEAPLLDQVLSIAGLDRASFAMVDLSTIEYLNDPFRLSWFPGVRAAPARAGCFEGLAVAPLDHHLAGPHPVSGAIRHAAALLDRPVEGPAMRAGARLAGFDAALERLCTGPAGPCGPVSGEVPEELARALGPLLAAIGDGLAARAEMVAEDGVRTPAFWYRSGGQQVLGGLGGGPDPDRDRRYLLGEGGRRKLYGEAARIAYAVEALHRSPERAAFAGRTGVRFDLETAAGWIRIRDAGDDVYEDDGTATLLLVDLGGADVHRDPAGANRDENNPVSVLVDLGGADIYDYDEVPDPDDRPGVLPSDAAGRATGAAGRIGATLSSRSRQGAARNGIALLFDFGPEDDRYRSLIASQGYAHQGVGVLFDEGGADTYLAEAASQGAGVYGIGLLLDGGGDDLRRSFTFSQGFGYVAGAGILADRAGNDVSVCDPGSAGGGVNVYPSPQMPVDGNNSFCQGAGFGRRHDADGKHLSGGIGILRDARGDDAYTASVFAQGAGYWQGTGLLSDGDGADTYQAFWYVQGAAAHFAVGILADAGGGDDVFDRDFRTRNMSLGAGHDLSTGVLLSGGGADEFHLGTLAGGASNCNGIGLFVDNGGDDRYLAFSDLGSGLGNFGADCPGNRSHLPSIGIQLDGGGADTYDYPASDFPVPSDGGTWGHARHGLASEHGGGVDGCGETGIHPESEVR